MSTAINERATFIVGGSGGCVFNGNTRNVANIKVGNIALWFHSIIDGIVINDITYGHGDGEGALTNPNLVLDKDEYFCKIRANAGPHNGDTIVTYLSMTTNKNKTITGGSLDSTYYSSLELENCYLIAVGGAAGNYLDSLCFDVIQNYSPSQIIKKDVGVIQALMCGPTEVVKYKESQSSTNFASNYSTVFNSTQNYSAAVEGEYYGAFMSANTNISYSETNYGSMSTAVSNSLVDLETYTMDVAEGSTSFYVTNVTFMQDAAGVNIWMYENSQSTPSWITLTNDALDKMTGYLFTAAGIEGLGFEVAPSDVPGVMMITGVSSTNN